MLISIIKITYLWMFKGIVNTCVSFEIYYIDHN